MADGSIFEAAKTSETPAGDGESNSSFLEMYVGEGKKYKDVEELAKAYYNADKFIPELKDDLNGLKEFTLEQFRKQAEQLNTNPKTPNGLEDDGDKNKSPSAPPKDGDDKVDLRELIRKEMENLDTTKRAQTNAQYTEEVMIKHFGSKEAAVEAVRSKAAELEVGPDFLANLAFTSPKAFFQNMGITEEAPKSKNTPASESTVNPLMIGKTNGQIKEGTYAWYENLRKTDQKKYWSPAVQKQLMDDALRFGDDFFKR